MKKILVTGGRGFVGTAVVAALKKQRYRVSVLTGDIRSRPDVLRALKGMDVVVHCAVVKEGKQAFDVNVNGAKMLIDCCCELGVRRVINISTQSVRLVHKGTYAATKAASDALFAQSGLDVTTLQVSLILSADERSVIGKLLSLVRKLPVIPVMGSGRETSSPILLGDLADSVVRCLETPKTTRRTYYVGGTETVSMNTLVDVAQKYLGVRKPVIHLPAGVALGLAHALSVLSNPPITVSNVLGGIQPTRGDPRPFWKDTRYTPRGFAAGLHDVLTGGKVRVGVVGFGKMGILHAALLSAMPDVVLVAVADVDTRLRSTVKSLGIHARFYPTLTAMLRHEALDAVYIATPTFTHASLIRDALMAGTNVFVEKPMVLDFEKALFLAALARRKHLITAVGYHLVFDPGYVRLKEKIRSGHLGTRLTVAASLFQSEVLGSKHGWFFDKKRSGGGVVKNPASHLIAWLVDTFGTPKRVSGSMKSVYSKFIEDEAIIHLRFSHVNARIRASWSVPGYQNLTSTVVVKGMNGETRLSQLSARGPGINLAPAARGLGYWYESRAFIEKILGRDTDPFTFERALPVEKTIYEIYKKIA